MPSTTTSVSKETISVLDDLYRYDSSAEVLNAKWLDLDNVMSVKRDKTIYAIRARNSYNFTGNDNTQFFANTISEYQLATNSGGDFASGTYFTSNIYRGFGTARDNGVANNIFEVLVYGNAVTGNLEDMGVGGSLSTDFAYGNFNNINVQSSVNIYGNLEESNLPRSNSPTLNSIPSAFAATISGNVLVTTAPDGTTANVNGNATCFQKVQYYDSAINPWNRLINATIGEKSYVNASTDPCDFNGVAVNNQITTDAGTTYTNEAFRHQFQLKANTNSTSLNPIYVARISRFGQRLADNKGGAIASNLAISSFSSNFFASIPSDNSLYAGGNLISGINITGNIVTPELYVFNNKFTTGQLFNEENAADNFNGNITNTLAGQLNNNRFLTITLNSSVPSIDGLKTTQGLTDEDRNITPSGQFQAKDSFSFVQANVLLSQGFMLMDRIAFTTPDPNFLKASDIFSQPGDNADVLTGGSLTANYDKLWFSTNMWTESDVHETSSKYLVIKGINIFDDKWGVTNLMSPNSLVMPSILGSPNFQYYNEDSVINAYLRRGDMSMVNYTYVNNKTLTGVKYLSTVPGFINNVILPLEKITLSANVLENEGDLINTATTQINLPLLANATASIPAYISCNYNILFSGNVNVENRIDKRANVVCPVNFANSFIANCWNYDQDGVSVSSAGKVISNVSIIYGENKTIDNGQVVKALRLDSPFANVNITYDLEFKRVIGQSNADIELTRDNYVFYANLNNQGLPPSTSDINILSSSSLSLLDNNSHLNGMNLQGVAYSEYNFSSLSSKFMDVGLTKSAVASESLPISKVYNYKYILPTALVQDSSNVESLPDNLINNSDSHLNVIVDYSQFNRLSPGATTNWHELTFYNVAYRYKIDSVSVVNGSTFNNNLLINGEQFDSSYLYNNADLDPTINGEIEASAISCYVYENISSDSSSVQPELLYPFTIPIAEEGTGNTVAPADYQNALFPGFRYTAGTSAFGFGKVSIFSTKSASDCDLILPANSDSALGPQIVKIIIQCQDLNAKTFKVGLSTEKCEIVSIKPVPHGRASDGTQKYATPVVCAIDGEANSYVIIMVECKSGDATEGLADDISQHMPVSINVAVIEKNAGKHQLTMDASLRVFDESRNISHTIVNDYFIKTSIAQTTYVNSSVGSFNQTAQLGVNIFSVPSNGAILSFVYEQTAVSQVLSYKRFDYALTPNSSDLYVKVNETSSDYFATSKPNQLPNYISDGIFPQISPDSTRYYLDTKTTGIFIDVANNTRLTNNIKPLIVGRSVEWVLKRSINNNEIVGRGLLSKSPSPATLLSTARTYNIYENLTQNASGYLHCITTNLINLASRCIMQKLQKNSFITNGSANKNNWQINTLSDQLNVMIVRVDGSNGRLFYDELNDNIIKQASVKLTTINQLIDLGSLFGGSAYAEKFVSFIMGPIRGFGYNPSAAKGELDMTACMFGLTIQPDNYCLVNLRPTEVNNDQKGINMNFQNVLFSDANTVKTNNENDFSLSFRNASFDYQYLNSSSPLSGTSFTLIGSYLFEGDGDVDIYTKEFTSNYTNILNQDQYLSSETTTLNALGDPSQADWQVDNITNQDNHIRAKIRKDNNNRYYFFLDELVNGTEANDRVYFRNNIDLTIFNNKKSLLLYTGLRPLVLNVLEVANSESNLETCITAASIFKWDNSHVNNDVNTSNIFTNLVSENVTTLLGAALSKQYYRVVLTNASAAPEKSFNYRSLKYTLSSTWFQPNSVINPNKNFFGAYRSASDMFQNLRLNIERVGSGAVSTTYNLQADYIGLFQNSQANETKILAGQLEELNYSNNVYQTFAINGTSAPAENQTLGFLFNMSVLDVIGEYASGDGQGFRVNILPAQMSIYSAIDANNNGEIDNHIANNVDNNIAGLSSRFGLENMFSEMNIVLPNNVQTSSYRLPTVLSSWELTRGFNSIKGCPFDIKLNNRWSVGYNLDCYFTINMATSAQFDVITISTKASTTASTTNSSDGVQLTNLEVRNSAPLYIKKQNDWARSLISENGLANNYGELSGLTFKLNSVRNVVAGSIVRIFVDNAIEENVNEWTVNTASSTNKTYQLYAYDQERYAALLDEQLSINNNFA